MDYQLAYKMQLEKLMKLAEKPEWKAYAWQYAQDLAADKSGVFAGIDVELASKMNGKKIISKKD